LSGGSPNIRLFVGNTGGALPCVRVTNRPGAGWAQRRVAAMARAWLGFILMLFPFLSGCAGTADSFPLNKAAQQTGPLQISFIRTGIGRGPVTIVMPDGEILKGEWRVNSSISEGFAFSGGQTASSLVVGGGSIEFVTTGPKTQILCRGDTGGAGHGNGECQTADGALWAIDW
jgi:hypothetical protein